MPVGPPVRSGLALDARATKNGQGWIRTSEGVKPADLQSAPFGHFGTYPFKREGSYRLALHGSQVVRSGRRVISNDEIRMTNDQSMAKPE